MRWMTLVQWDEQWSRTWMQWVSASPWLSLVARVWARTGLWVLFVSLSTPFMSLLNMSNAPDQLRGWFFAWVVGVSMSLLMAHWVSRPRPFIAHSDWKSLIATTWLHWSFPSKHILIATLFFLPLFFEQGSFSFTWIISVIIWLGLGLARVGVGVHYFGDIVGGLFIGACSILLTTLVFSLHSLL